MTATTCVPEPYSSSSVCLIPPSSDVSVPTSVTTAVPREPTGTLPFTGGDYLGFTVAGLLLMIGGGVAIVAAHRRSRWNAPAAPDGPGLWRAS